MIITHRVQLPNLMKQLKLPLIGIEIGTADGGSAVDFMTNGLEQIYCVDVWHTIEGQRGDAANSMSWHESNLDVAKRRLSKWGDNVKLLRGLSKEIGWMIPDNSVGLLYLDGDHSYEGVTTDLECYFHKVVEGGIVAGHDFLEISYGVRKAVEDFCSRNDYQVNIIREDKDEDSGFFFVKTL